MRMSMVPVWSRSPNEADWALAGGRAGGRGGGHLDTGEVKDDWLLRKEGGVVVDPDLNLVDPRRRCLREEEEVG